MSEVAGRNIEELLDALGVELESAASPHIGLCVIGGAALGALGLVDRPTKDIDVVASLEESDAGVQVHALSALPDAVIKAASEVARQFGIERWWINVGPSSLMDVGLPSGFESRLTPAAYGSALTIYFASRVDQICFKTYAAADVGGRHAIDLVALLPTEQEIEFALRWVIRHDPSEGFRSQLRGLAEYLGVPNVLDSIEE
ncbi:MAG: hypothetical protein KJ747_10745 [Actinobacteria bacterium]|nr:hypothetical protein [Actinomycetota bacterium]MCG2808251.1 hypothetical protein [Coriobacteriia bacterium]